MRVVIAGWGRVGRQVALLLADAGDDVSIIDARPETEAIELLVAESDLSEGIRWWAMLTGLGLLAGSGLVLGATRGRRKEAE